MPSLSASSALEWTAVIAAIGAGLAALELLAFSREFNRGGVFAPTLVAGFRGWFGRTFSFSARGVRFAAVVQLTASGLLIWSGNQRVELIAACVLLGLNLLLSLRMPTAVDAADRMQTVVLAGVAGGLASQSSHGATVALMFIALQGVLAYGIAGSLKLIDPAWTRGDVLPKILGAEGMDRTALADRLWRHPSLGRSFCWMLMAWECSGLVVLVAPAWALGAWLGVALVFHLGCAVVMGLNRLFWSFLATYPAIIFVNGLVRSWI